MSDSMFKMIVSHSDSINTSDVVSELIDDAEQKLEGEIPGACILYVAIDHEYQVLLNAIHDKWNNIRLIGGTTDGEMSSEMGFAEDSVVMILLCSSEVEFSIGVGEGLETDIPSACAQAVSQASSEVASNPCLCITNPGNMDTNLVQVISSLKKALGGQVPIFGGVPGDQWRFQTQYQFFGRQVYTDAVPILLFHGNIGFSYGVESGWKPLGEKGVVTKSEGNTVYAIDNAPAIEFYKLGLGVTGEPSAEFPLVVLDEAGEIQYLRGAARAVDDNSGAVAFVGHVPEGATVRLSRADRDTILLGTRKAIATAIEKLPENAEVHGGLLISCASRKSLLGSKTMEELRIANQMIGENIPLAGFYGYGEIAPTANEGLNSKLHNQTFVILLITDR
jgi:hypothetical protein